MKYNYLLYVTRIRNCLAQLYAKDITPDDKQELDEALQREVCTESSFSGFSNDLFSKKDEYKN